MDEDARAMDEVKEMHHKLVERQKFSVELSSGDMIAVTKGTPIILENPDSGTLLEVAEGVKSSVKHATNTDVKLLRKATSTHQCLVSPVVCFHTADSVENLCEYKYKATFPHVANPDQLASLKVTSGNIRRPESLREVRKGKPDEGNEPYCEVNSHQVVLHANHFCDLMCVAEEKICTSKILVIPFGVMEVDESDNESEAGEQTHVNVKTFLCSYLYSYPSYRDVSNFLRKTY